MSSPLKPYYVAITLVLAGILPVQANQHCIVPQLDTAHGCVWPEQLGIRIALGHPLSGAVMLDELVEPQLGAQYNAAYRFYRVANSSLVIGVQGDALIVRDMFYLPQD